MDAIEAIDMLPSWRDTAARRSIVEYVCAITGSGTGSVPVPERVAVFDNDGTLWCERPGYLQAQFLSSEVAGLLEQRPELTDDPVLACVARGDIVGATQHGMAALLDAVTIAHDGMSPSEFTERVRAWAHHAHHDALDRPVLTLTYEPMLELVALLRAAQFRVFIVTGGGVEFVRALSDQLYGVPPEHVIGTSVVHDVTRSGTTLRLTRTHDLDGDPNEGIPKVVRIQSHLGVQPIVAVGNSAGDTEMLEFAESAERSNLCVVVDHDDATREYAYASASFTDPQARPLTDVARERGWLTISMADDWERVFAEEART